MTSSNIRPPRASSRRARPWRTVGIGAAIVACVLGVCTVGASSRATAAASSSPYTITVAQTAGLTDGEPDPVSVTSSNPKADPVGWVDIELCNPRFEYTSFAAVKTFGRCGFSPGSSAYTSATQSATQSFPGEPSGARSFPDKFITGVGSATYEGNTLNCDSTHPCDLVVSVFTSETNYNNEVSADTKAFKLTFLPFGGVAGCKGTDTDALQTVSSDRLVDAYTDWSKQACTVKDGPDGDLAPTENTFVDEGGTFGAVGSFAAGNADLAYAAGGYDLPGFSTTTKRPYVAVPIALNAEVVAASGGQDVPGYGSTKQAPVTASQPFTHLDITAAQAASIFGGGYLSPALTKAVIAENKQLQVSSADGGPLSQLVPYVAPGGSTFTYPEAIAGIDATTVFTSTYFTDLAKAAWNSGPHAKKGQKKDVQRGVFSSFAQPGAGEPQFTSMSNYSARTDFEKQTLPYKGIGPLPLWILTDRATATEVGYPYASLASQGKDFVAPTEATMDAALDDMTKQPDGTLLPDPTKAAASGKAYPLTFVEYALAPTEPLVDASCKPRTASEELLVKWLEFLTTTGQSGLAPGFVPLTSSLKVQAAAAIAKVGTAAQTGTCAPKTTTPTTAPVTPTSPDQGVTNPVTSPDSSQGTTPATSQTTTATGPGTTKPTTSVTTTTPTTVPTAAPGKHRLAAIQIPQLPAQRSASWTLPSIALAALALLAGGMALRTSGRSPLLLLRTTAGRLRRRIGRS